MEHLKSVYVLNEITKGSHWLLWTASFIVAIAAIGLITFYYVTFKAGDFKNKTSIVKSALLVLAFAVYASLLFYDTATYERQQYEIILKSDVLFLEFTKTYNIISVRDKIVTVEFKDKFKEAQHDKN